MITISPTNSRIFRLNIDFLNFAWAKPWWEVPGSFGSILNRFYCEYTEIYEYIIYESLGELMPEKANADPDDPDLKARKETSAYFSHLITIGDSNMLRISYANCLLLFYLRSLSLGSKKKLFVIMKRSFMHF